MHQLFKRLWAIQEAAQDAGLAQEQASHSMLLFGRLTVQDGVEDEGVGTPGEIIMLSLVWNHALA